MLGDKLAKTYFFRRKNESGFQMYYRKNGFDLELYVFDQVFQKIKLLSSRQELGFTALLWSMQL